MIYKQLCVAKSALNLNDRCLAVLSSLLSFCRKTRSMRKTASLFSHPIASFLCAPMACQNQRCAAIWLHWLRPGL
ncbi:hypothetical protein HED49_23460 [Ochrobactrum daejeonense]|nr:hypothetical protein [Brucella daejeonensis]